MIAIAVLPIARPIKKRRKTGLPTAWWIGDAGCSRMVPNVKAETIKTARHVPSIKYFGQWFFKTSDMAFDPAIVDQLSLMTFLMPPLLPSRRSRCASIGKRPVMSLCTTSGQLSRKAEISRIEPSKALRPAFTVPNTT